MTTAPDPATEEWLSVSETAALIGVSRNTVRKWADQKRLPVSRTPGGHRRFRRSSMEAFGNRPDVQALFALQELRDQLRRDLLRVSESTRTTWEETERLLKAQCQLGEQQQLAVVRAFLQSSRGQRGPGQRELDAATAELLVSVLADGP